MQVKVNLSNVKPEDKEIVQPVIQFDGQNIKVMTEEEMNQWTKGEEEKLFLYSCIDWNVYSYVKIINDSDCYSFKEEWVEIVQ